MKKNIVITPRASRISISHAIAKSFFGDDAFYVSQPDIIEEMICNKEFEGCCIFVLDMIINERHANELIKQAESFTIYANEFLIKQLSYILLNKKVEIIPNSDGVTYDLWDYFHSNDDIPLFLKHIENAVRAVALNRSDLSIFLYVSTVDVNGFVWRGLMNNEFEMSDLIKKGELILRFIEDGFHKIGKETNVKPVKMAGRDVDALIIPSDVPDRIAYAYALSNGRDNGFIVHGSSDKGLIVIKINWNIISQEEFTYFYESYNDLFNRTCV